MVDKAGGVAVECGGERLAKGKTQVAKKKYAGSSAEHLWRRLDSMDFMNRGMLFAATLLLCFFPFVIVANALAGHPRPIPWPAISGSTSKPRPMWLNCSPLRRPPPAPSPGRPGSGSYWAEWRRPPPYNSCTSGPSTSRAADERHTPPAHLAGGAGRLFGLGGLGGAVIAQGRRPALLGVIGLTISTAFWWFTQWFLLGGRIPWRELFPSAIATAVCWVGMAVVFAIIFSGTVISDDKKYGAMGWSLP